MSTVAAVDLGATSGRVVAASLTAEGIGLEEIARFPHRPMVDAGVWRWDVEALFAQVCAGLLAAGPIASCGIDTWAVDYGVVRADRLVGSVRSYRDPSHARGMEMIETRMSRKAMYAITGTQRIAINTVFQIAAEESPRITEGTTFLLLPDLLTWMACGARATDVTNASSTGMLDVRTRTWSPEILAALRVPASAFLRPDEPGGVRGTLDRIGLPGVPLVGVATHDTASAFAGTPLVDRDRALVLSLGTWALLGAEVLGVVPDESACNLDVTHELGLDGTVRLLKNVTGMWLLEECRRVWNERGESGLGIPELLGEAEAATPFAGILDVDDPLLAEPGQTPEGIASRLDRPWDGTRGALVRSLLESLVAKLARRAEQIEVHLGGRRDVIHVVGGGSRLEPVMQWLADATGKRVTAGPVEATAIGNAVVQWRTLGEISDLAEARARIRRLDGIRTYEPAGSADRWAAYAARGEI